MQTPQRLLAALCSQTADVNATLHLSAAAAKRQKDKDVGTDKEAVQVVCRADGGWVCARMCVNMDFTFSRVHQACPVS